MSALTYLAPLFVPANRPDRFANAAASGADAVILDLEDAVAAQDKAEARQNLCNLAQAVPVIVRINGAETPWHDGDCEAITGAGIAAVMLPKAERVEDCARISSLAPVIALVETAVGMAKARDLAQSGSVARLAFGSVDYASDLACDHSVQALQSARSELVLASRLGGLPAPLDGVTLDLISEVAARDDTLHARAMGFGGKLAIHPRQVAPILGAFRPQASEIDWAKRVLASGDGAVKMDGVMVDEPVRRRAGALLERAQSAVSFGEQS